MASPPWPHCEIKWIDCVGKDTPDTKEPVAIIEVDNKRFYVCQDHLDTMMRKASHHAKGCAHYSHEGFSAWTLVRRLP